MAAPTAKSIITQAAASHGIEPSLLWGIFEATHCRGAVANHRRIPSMTDWRREKKPFWDVEIKEHTVKAGPKRIITIPASTQKKISAPNQRKARVIAIEEVHRTHSVPLWKPCLRESWPHTKATPHQNPYER